MGSGDEVSTLAGLLVVGLGIFLAGLGIVFARPELRGRVVGFAVLSIGAVTVVAAAGPAGSWTAAGTVGATLIPLVVLAAWLAARLEDMARAPLGRAPVEPAKDTGENEREVAQADKRGGKPNDTQANTDAAPRPATHASLDDDPR